MSRIGKKAIAIPSGVEVTVNDTVVTVKKGSKSIDVETHGRVGVEIADNRVNFSLVGEDSQDKAFWGTYRALTNNAIIGLNEGFTKSLEINGVGYRAAVKGKVLELQLGFSHPINFDITDTIDITVDKNIINIKGSSKQEVGQVAAKIRSFRPPEPYKGKGVKYTDEHIVRKAGKTAKK
ncbi:MAG: 50S ribosomal protein L6 [Campylobacterota bacterium]|nr:50S ribosomal protein L6 [Campylobacterota bacterium]